MPKDERQKGFLEKLSAHNRKQLLAFAEALHYSAGEFILQQGARAADFFVVKSGHVSIEVGVQPRGRIILMRVDPGEVFGWSALLESATETSSARALDDVEVLGIPGSVLKAHCRVDLKLGIELYRNVLEVVSDCLAACRLASMDIFSGERRKQFRSGSAEAGPPQ